MFKKFINGLLFGAGFGIALIIVAFIFFQFFFHPMMTRKISEPDRVVATPPGIQEPRKYLGSSGTYSSGFRDNQTGILASGNGEIVGQATANGEPVSGLQLRLALNGSVMSQWATTDADGQYIVRVPYGEYRVDGFQLNTDSADRVLVGKIDHPQNHHFSNKFKVSSESEGHGPTLRFVDPIRKSMSKDKYSVTEDITLSWEPYPGADHYTVQIYEKSDPYAFVGRKRMFEWSNRPEVTTTAYSLKESGIELKAGYFYVFDIDAHDKNRAIISESDDLHSGYDFEVTE